MKRILVAGANGFLGLKYISGVFPPDVSVDALLFDRDKRFENIVKNKCHKTFFWDYEKGDPFGADDRFDVIVNFAWAGANGPDKSDERIQENNIRASINLAKIAKAHGAGMFIGIGTVSEKAYLANPTAKSASIVYGKYKHECQKALSAFCESNSMWFYWLQLANLFGRDDGTGNLFSFCLNNFRNGKPALLGPCDQYYDFLYADDAVEAIRRFSIMAGIRPDTYYVGSSNPRLLREYILDIARPLKATELARFGSREDDGMVFQKEMFDNSKTVSAIGIYESNTFQDHVTSILRKEN